MSDGNILHESKSMMSTSNNEELSNRSQERIKVLSGSTPDVSACKSDLSFSRFGYSSFSIYVQQGTYLNGIVVSLSRDVKTIVTNVV